MLVWGASAFLVFLVPRPLAGRIWGGFRIALTVAVTLVVITTLLALPLQTAIISSGWKDAVSLPTVRDVLLQTTVGTAWAAQASAAVLLCAALALSGHRQRGLAVAASALGLAALALTGHASMSEGWLEVVHRGNDMLHLLSGGAWLGALVAFVPVLRALDGPGSRQQAQIALRRFSTVGHLMVAAVLLSGALNTALVLGRLPIDRSSPYQVLLAAKIMLVASMVVLAMFNRYLLVPRMHAHRTSALNALRWGSIAEVVIGMVVIGLVAIFGMIEPL